MQRLRLLLLLLVLAALAHAVNTQPIDAPDFPLDARDGGNIIFTRHQIVRVPGTTVDLPLPSLWVLASDGTDARGFFTPEEYVSAKEARWSPDYDQLVFTSDYMECRSACSMDLWLAEADGSVMRRVTGGDTPVVGAVGTIIGTIDTKNVTGRTVAVQHTEVNIAVPGAIAVHHPNPDMTFEITGVPAGEKVWVRAWIDKFHAGIKTIEVLPNQVNQVGAVNLQGMNFIAGKGSVTPDGRYVVGMGGMVSETDEADTPTYDTAEPGKQRQISAVENIAVYDMRNGGQIAGMFQAVKAMMQNGKDAVVGPDGRSIACGWGQMFMEDLALITVDQLIADKPQPQTLVPGQRLFPSAATGFQAFLVGAGTPAWRPDGGQIAFCRGAMGTEFCAGDIWLANMDGSGLAQLTNVGPTHIAFQPCYSPDGRSIVFTVLTGNYGPIKPEHLALSAITADIWRIDVNGQNLQQLTNDGHSSEPAWGP